MGRKKKQHENIVHRSNKCVELAAISVYHKYVLSYCAFVICLVKAHHQSFHIHRIHRIHLVFMAIICSTPNKGAIFLYSFFFSDAYMCRIDGILLGYRELFVWRKFENNWSAFLSDIQINVGKRKIPIFRGKIDELCLNFSCVFLRSCFKDLWIFKVILLMELSKVKFLKSLKELSDLILYTNCHGIFLYLKDFEFTLK